MRPFSKAGCQGYRRRNPPLFHPRESRGSTVAWNRRYNSMFGLARHRAAPGRPATTARQLARAAEPASALKDFCRCRLSSETPSYAEGESRALGPPGHLALRANVRVAGIDRDLKLAGARAGSGGLNFEGAEVL